MNLNITKKTNKNMNNSNTLYCSECGSDNVETKMWVNANTEEIGGECSDTSVAEDNYCKDCEEHVKLLSLESLFQKFGEIPVNNKNQIEADFLQFPAGTSKLDIWKWFDERCPNNLHDDLLCKESIS